MLIGGREKQLFQLLGISGDSEMMNGAWMSRTDGLLSVLDLSGLVQEHNVTTVTIEEIEDWTNSFRIWAEKAHLGRESVTEPSPKREKKAKEEEPKDRSPERNESVPMDTEDEIEDLEEFLEEPAKDGDVPPEENPPEVENKKTGKKRKAAAVESSKSFVTPATKKCRSRRMDLL